MGDVTDSLDLYNFAFMLSCCRITLPFKSNVAEDTWAIQISFTNNSVPEDARKLADEFFNSLVECKYHDNPEDIPQSVKNYLANIGSKKKPSLPAPSPTPSEDHKEELQVESKKPAPTKSKLSKKKQPKKSKKK